MAERKCTQRADKLLPGNSAYCNCVIVGNVQLKALPIIPFHICKLWRWSENFNRNMLQQGKKKKQENTGKTKFVYKNGNEAVERKKTKKKKKKCEKGKEILCNFWSQISTFFSFYYNFASFSVAAQLRSLRLSFIVAAEQLKYEQDSKKKTLKSWLPSSAFNCVAAAAVVPRHDVDDEELKQWLGCCNNTMHPSSFIFRMRNRAKMHRNEWKLLAARHCSISFMLNFLFYFIHFVCGVNRVQAGRAGRAHSNQKKYSIIILLRVLFVRTFCSFRFFNVSLFCSSLSSAVMSFVAEEGHIQCLGDISLAPIQFVYSFLLQINALSTSLSIVSRTKTVTVAASCRPPNGPSSFRCYWNRQWPAIAVPRTRITLLAYDLPCQTVSSSLCMCDGRVMKTWFDWNGKESKKKGKMEKRHGLSCHFLDSIFFSSSTFVLFCILCCVAFHQMPNNMAAALAFGRMPIEWRRWFAIHQKGRKTHRPKNAEEP